MIWVMAYVEPGNVWSGCREIEVMEYILEEFGVTTSLLDSLQFSIGL